MSTAAAEDRDAPSLPPPTTGEPLDGTQADSGSTGPTALIGGGGTNRDVGVAAAGSGGGGGGSGAGGGGGGGDASCTDGAAASPPPAATSSAAVAELFSTFTDPASRLNRIVDGMGHLDIDAAAGRHTMATGTHEGGGGGRVFTVTKHKKKQPPAAGAAVVVPPHAGADADLAEYNYTEPEDVAYYLSDTDSEIGEMTLAELLERDIEDLKFDLEENMQLAGPADQAMMRAFLESPLAQGSAGGGDSKEDTQEVLRLPLPAFSESTLAGHREDAARAAEAAVVGRDSAATGRGADSCPP